MKFAGPTRDLFTVILTILSAGMSYVITVGLSSAFNTKILYWLGLIFTPFFILYGLAVTNYNETPIDSIISAEIVHLGFTYLYYTKIFGTPSTLAGGQTGGKRR
jgi:hypothetical protein